MATRYSGSITVRLTVDDHGVYTGTVKAPGMKAWPFRMKASPEAARKFASDSQKMYTLMAEAAINFAQAEDDQWFAMGNFTMDGKPLVYTSKRKANDPRAQEENPYRVDYLDGRTTTFTRQDSAIKRFKRVARRGDDVMVEYQNERKNPATSSKAITLRNHIAHLQDLIRSAPMDDKIKLRQILTGVKADLHREEKAKKPIRGMDSSGAMTLMNELE